MSFTAHNILLNDGSRTIQDNRLLLEEEPTFQAAVRSMKNVFGSELAGVRVADLGCLEGGYTAGFARLGMNSVGLEVRQSNIDNCEIVRLGVSLPNLSFIKDDVHNIERYGKFDVIFCSGLLYHLENPRAFIETMARCTNKMIILHTHFATHEPSKHASLSDIATHEGMLGRWFAEHQENDDEGREKHKWASWNNQSSFWNMKGGLIEMLQTSGFSLVYEQMDWLGHGIEAAMSPEGRYSLSQRTMIVGVRV
jgi:SAM-dependent methyltransferase